MLLFFSHLKSFFFPLLLLVSFYLLVHLLWFSISMSLGRHSIEALDFFFYSHWTTFVGAFQSTFVIFVAVAAVIRSFDHIQDHRIDCWLNYEQLHRHNHNNTRRPKIKQKLFIHGCRRNRVAQQFQYHEATIFGFFNSFKQFRCNHFVNEQNMKKKIMFLSFH